MIREGVFGWVRHPIYLGEILLYAGLLMLSLSLAGAGVWFVGAVFLHQISRQEERLLLARFGDEYAHYCAKCPCGSRDCADGDSWPRRAVRAWLRLSGDLSRSIYLDREE